MKPGPPAADPAAAALAIQIRAEQPGDAAAIRTVIDRAFGRPDEGALVDVLRSACEDSLSLVAVVEGTVVGHILFTAAVIELAGGGEVAGTGLAPLAVLPGWQNRKIGSALVEAGLAALAQTACPFVIVLGHPRYYPRFGFGPASRLGIRCKWEVPDDVFMIRILDTAVMRGVSGLAHYRPEFDSVT